MKFAKIYGAEIICGLAGAYGVFILPWSLPVGRPNISISYIYGYNNLAAWAVVAFILLLLFCCRRWFRPALSAWETRLHETLLGNPVADGNHRLQIAFAATAVAAVGLIIFIFLAVPSAYGEMQYFIPRLELMTAGYRPYRDFQFTYGPAMLYPSLWLYQVAAGKMSLPACYGAALVVHWLLGLGLIYYVVKSLGGRCHRVTVFLCLTWTAVNLSLGLNYTPLRFALTLAGLVYLHRTVSGGRQPAAVLPAVVLAAFLPLLGLAVSQEIGVAMTIAVTVYFSLHLFSTDRRLAPCAFGTLLSLPIARLAFGSEYFEVLLSSGGGGLNFPIFPTAHVLFLLGIAGMILPAAGFLSLRQQGSQRAYLCAFVVLLGLGLPPALGRCDWGHIFFNGFGLFLVALAVITKHPSKPVRGCAMAAYILIFPVGAWVSFWGHYRGGVIPVLEMHARKLGLPFAYAEPDKTLADRSIIKKTAYDLALARHLVVSYGHVLLKGRTSPAVVLPPALPAAGVQPPLRDATLEWLPRGSLIGVPLQPEPETVRLLKAESRYFPEYYTYPTAVLNEADLARKMRDLARMNLVLVPRSALAAAPPEMMTPTQRDSRFLSHLFLFPVKLPAPKNPPFLPEGTILNIIQKDFMEVNGVGDWVLMKRIIPALDERLEHP